MRPACGAGVPGSMVQEGSCPQWQPTAPDDDHDDEVEGCEDTDDDDDGVIDTSDACPTGELGWTSDSTTDYDGDGCKDSTTEDLDDDNDGWSDTDESACGTNSLNSSSIRNLKPNMNQAFGLTRQRS